MGTHRKSGIRQTLDRLDERMAIGESRREVRQQQRATGEHLWTFSKGKIHSYKTRTTYQEHLLRFVNWSCEVYHLKTLEQLDERANELASLYLQQEIIAHKSASTLQVERSSSEIGRWPARLSFRDDYAQRSRARVDRQRIIAIFSLPTGNHESTLSAPAACVARNWLVAAWPMSLTLCSVNWWFMFATGQAAKNGRHQHCPDMK